MNETELPVWMVGLSNPDSTGCTWYRIHAASFEIVQSDNGQAAWFFSKERPPGTQLVDTDVVAHFRAAHINVIAEKYFIAPQQSGNVEPRKPH